MTPAPRASGCCPRPTTTWENTFVRCGAGFEAGADIVEFDVHPTTDGEFAVFHDWTLDCRTDGRGVTREHAMAELKLLDIGYGYTADSGKTFPFRGRAIGQMPTLSEVLATFPDRRLLINVKSRDRSEGEKLAAALNALPAERRRLIMVYGGDEPMEAVRRLVPGIRTISRATIKSCLVSYIGYGWTGMVPQACANAMVMLPINGSHGCGAGPGPFPQPHEGANSEVFVLGPYTRRGVLNRIDTPEQLALLASQLFRRHWTIEDRGDRTACAEIVVARIPDERSEFRDSPSAEVP
jgi:glycerophosphoryl diester phosphodiesterase